jgi:hypothetical protein
MIDRKLLALDESNLSKQSRQEFWESEKLDVRASLSKFGPAQTKILRTGENCQNYPPRGSSRRMRIHPS